MSAPTRTRWQRRAIGLALGLVTVLGVSVAFLQYHLPIAAVPRVVRAPADLDHLPPLTVCWVESARVPTATASALLIRHPSGELLVDAGDSLTPREDFAQATFGARMFIDNIPAHFQPERPIGALLANLNVAPGGLRAVLISHAHLDHLGGAMDLPGVPIWTSQAELDFAARNARTHTTHIAPRYAEALAARGRAITFLPRPYEHFEQSADLFGDGSVVVVPLPGHTPGSVGTFINLSPTQRLFHVGDSINERVQVRELLGKRQLMRQTDVDEARANQTVGLLHQVSEDLPALQILPAHERAAWVAAFGEVPRCLGGAPSAAR